MLNNTALAFEIVQEFLDEKDVSYAELLEALKIIKENDFLAYENILKSLDDEDLGNIASLMPEHMLSDVLELSSSKKIALAIGELESDDATDLMQSIEEISDEKANQIFANLSKQEQDEILFLKRYDDDKAGAYMQTELFKMKLSDTLSDAIKSYKKLKVKEELEHIFELFIVDDEGKLQFSLPVADMILYEFNATFSDILQNNPSLSKELHFVKDYEDIDEAIILVRDYDLSVIAVVDDNNKLLGRITHDDIHDLLQDSATEQIYNFAGVGDIDSEDESVFKAAKSRATWLIVNLCTSLISAHVISIFSDAIEKLVALAALMPIVASMGGNTGSQALAVTIRKLALGESDFAKAKKTIFREISISFMNASVFAILMGFIAYVWFNMPMLSLVIFISMILNLGIAGFIGSFIPLLLKKCGFDPAIGSSILLTALTDALGFFSFLLLAKLILL
ncbi:magnesium transporter [Campylobacter canadensis]|uniref:Magnesium transporter MgtE n=1 Tax=Campylobacter canadensis TaxID=449520 RepID=A0ABS7WSH2_9BACT|nr:magnesium transporter [Campylobacter canadensis]MBZ7987463.1 magnesium transporter [Campylobacter canadensis]MBZ7994806.1 magnesium transporter [Campylobacter canadensis]MBZ7996409.1 magnesium transporter [Campylobacter canadensis]MBZ7998443.1 magnesium transporter [Campylobacter canadensis]MBZ8000157.1 magnesium transporter [Campylobacter canadensis]